MTSKVLITLKTNIFLQFSHSHPSSVTSEVLRIMYSRETKKIDTPQRIVIKNEINRNNSGFSVVYPYVRLRGMTFRGDNNFEN